MRTLGWDLADVESQPEFVYAGLSALMRLPSSWLHAAINNWERPWTDEAIMLADLIDIQGLKAAGRKWKRVFRVWDKKNRHGGTKLAPSRVRDLLRKRAGR